MSSSRDDRYYASLGKTGKSPPLGDQGTGFFPTGQGGRTVLPPISSAFPTSLSPAPGSYPSQYTQPRSAPRYDYNPALYNNPWPASNQTSPPMNNYTTFQPDPTDNRYSSQNYYAYPSRSSPAVPDDVDLRKLPPLSTSGGGRDGWSSNANPYPVSSAVPPNTSGIRSPTASYPPAFTSYPSSGPPYSYNIPMNELQNQTQSHTASAPTMASDPQRSSSYAQNQIPAPSYTPPPVSPTTGTLEEPTIKKKRKRADPAQLRVLNETYARTAFPSTEERQALARQLDMSARSVQIWFQNKRQSMRQTRQSSASSPTVHHSFTLSPQGDALADDVGQSSSGYEATGMQMSSAAYVPRSAQDSHTTPTFSPSTAHRHPRNQDAAVADSMKSQQWPRY